MPNFRFLLHDSIYYEMSGVVIEDQPSGSIRIILLNGKVIYFHNEGAKSFRDFMSLPSWPNLPVIDTGYINKYIAEAAKPEPKPEYYKSDYEFGSRAPQISYNPGPEALKALDGRKLPLTVPLPAVSHPGFPLGYTSDLAYVDDLKAHGIDIGGTSRPINTDKSRAGVNAIHAVPGSPKLNIVAIRKAAGIHGEDK